MREQEDLRNKRSPDCQEVGGKDWNDWIGYDGNWQGTFLDEIIYLLIYISILNDVVRYISWLNLKMRYISLLNEMIHKRRDLKIKNKKMRPSNQHT